MRSNRLAFLRAFFVAAATAALFLAVGGDAQAQGAKPMKKVVFLQYNVVPDLGDAHLWILPHALGYFADEGLDVTVQLAGGSAGAIQLLAAGKGDIATSTPDQLMIGIQKGVKMKAFFEQNRSYGSALVVQKSANITTVEQLKTYLKGSAIGVASLGSGRIHYARAWLRDLGLQDDVDVKIVAVGTGAQAATALKADRVRALSIYDAAYAAIEAVSDIRFQRFETNWQGPLFSGVIAASDDALAKDPEMIKGIGRAVAKSLVFATTNPEAVVKIFWKLYPETKPKAGEEAKELANQTTVVKSMLPNWLYEMDKPGDKWGNMSAADWEKNQEFNLKAGVLTATAPVAGYFTDQYVDDFNKFDPEPVKKQAREFNESMIKYTSSN